MEPGRVVQQWVAVSVNTALLSTGFGKSSVKHCSTSQLAKRAVIVL